MSAERGRLLGLHSGQIVSGQVAVFILLAAAVTGAPLLLLPAVPCAAVLATIALGRFRRRWLYQWLGTGLRYAARQRELRAGADAGALLRFVAPTARVQTVDAPEGARGVISDSDGLVAVLELGETGSLLSDGTVSVPSPRALLPPPGPDSPDAAVQLLVTSVPAPASRSAAGLPATSYRQLTDGRVPAQMRALLAVRVRRDSGWSDEDLHRCLASTLRRVHRRLAQDGVPARTLGPQAVYGALADLAHHDPGQPVRVAWPAVATGTLRQATVALDGWPELAGEAANGLIPRLLTLPVTTTTVALTVDARRASLVVRVAGPDPATLGAAVQALRRLLAALGTRGTRCDGDQLDALAATLPLARLWSPGAAVSANVVGMPLAGSGLMLGRNRHGEPVTLRLLRPEPTRAMLVGGVRAAALVTMRALALGTQVLVQTARPQAWEAFLRGVSGPGDVVAVVPPGRPIALAPGNALRPQLIVVDVGTVLGDPPVPPAAWRATLLIRDELGAPDLDALARADVALLQPLSPTEAAMAGGALGLGENQEWLSRIRGDMVAVVSRRVVRWALLSATSIEQQVIGSTERALAG